MSIAGSARRDAPTSLLSYYGVSLRSATTWRVRTMRSDAEASRRSFLKLAGAGTAATGILGTRSAGETHGASTIGAAQAFDVRKFGAKGDGVTLDTAPIKNDIDASAAAD